MDPRLMQQLIASRKILKRMYKSLKSDIAQAQIKLERNLKPIKKVLVTVATIKTETPIKEELKSLISPASTPRKKHRIFQIIYILNIYLKLD